MKDVKRAQDLIGSDVYDTGGERIGRVGNVYVDDSSHQPEWVTVRTGMFGTKESFVPLSGAERGDRGINVGVSKEKVRDAPRVDVEGGHLSDNEGRDLYTYYGMQPGSTSPQQRDVPQQQSTGEAGAAAGTATAASGRGTAEQDARSSTGGSETGTASTSAAGAASAGTASTATGATESTSTATGSMPGTRPSGTAQRSTGESTTRGDTADMKSMTRSEERLRINTEQAESGRVRVRKYVVTEQQSVTVPVSHEEVRIEREPISESERGSMSSSARMSEDEQEVVLHEDRPTVHKETVPVERIRLRTETVTEERTVQDEVQMERFDVQDQSGRHHRDESDTGRSGSGRTGGPTTGGSATGGSGTSGSGTGGSGAGGHSGSSGQSSSGGTTRS